MSFSPQLETEPNPRSFTGRRTSDKNPSAQKEPRLARPQGGGHFAVVQTKGLEPISTTQSENGVLDGETFREILSRENYPLKYCKMNWSYRI
jgi:hypothetical protein